MSQGRGRGRGRGRARPPKQKSAPDTKPERAAQSYRPMGAALTVEEVHTPCVPPLVTRQHVRLVMRSGSPIRHAQL